MTKRRCSKCSEVKTEDLFPKRERGLQCYACLALSQAAWLKKNPGKVVVYRAKTREWHKDNRDKVYDNISRHRYKLSVSDVDALIAQQNNLCAICKQPPSMKGARNQRLFVDHCHKTEKVRGMICNDCNLGLGRAKDSVEILQSMIEYLNHNG